MIFLQCFFIFTYSIIKPKHITTKLCIYSWGTSMCVKLDIKYIINKPKIPINDISISLVLLKK